MDEMPILATGATGYSHRDPQSGSRPQNACKRRDCARAAGMRLSEGRRERTPPLRLRALIT